MNMLLDGHPVEVIIKQQIHMFSGSNGRGAKADNSMVTLESKLKSKDKALLRYKMLIRFPECRRRVPGLVAISKVPRFPGSELGT